MGTAFAIYPSNLFPKYSPSNDRRLCQPNNQYAIFSQGKDISQHPVHSLMLEPATQSSYLWITRECEACCLVLHLKMIWKCCPGTARQLVKKHSVTRSQLWAAYLMEQTKIHYWLIVLLVRSALGPKTFTITSNQVTPWSLWTRHSNHWQGHELVFLTVCSTRISPQSALLENVTVTAGNARGKELARPSLHWASMALWICYRVFSFSLKKLPLLQAGEAVLSTAIVSLALWCLASSCFQLRACCPLWRHVDFFFYQHTRSVQWKWDWFYFLTTALRTRPLKESCSREFRSPLTWMLQQRLRHTPFLSSKLWEGDEIARRTSTSVMFHVERQPWTTAALPNDSLYQK